MYMASVPEQSQQFDKLLSKYAQVFVVGSAGAAAPVVFKKRRDLQRKALSSPTLFFGINQEPGAENLWWMNGVRTIQEPALLFLSGVNQPKVAVFLDPRDATGSADILFLPQKNPSREFWDGTRFGLYPSDHPDAELNLQELAQLTGFTQFADIQTVFDLVSLKLGQSHLLDVYAHSYDLKDWDSQAKAKGSKVQKIVRDDHNYLAYKQTKQWFRKHRPEVKISAFAKQHLDLRVLQDQYMQNDAIEATRITEQAFVQTLELWAEFQNENQLAKTLEYKMLVQNPWGLAFPTICASGKNACVLHYLKNDAKLHPSELVLLDFGARFGTQHADISRTLPISGKFNPLQALLYGIVLEAQKLNESYIKPGVTLAEANERVWAFIETALKSKFVAQGGKMIRAYEGKPHGVSHLMGEQEHEGDPFRLYARVPLRTGMLISNEPGLYGHFEITLQGKKYSEWIGIRIEDNLLITTDGCINLSSAIPKEINEIETLLSKGLKHG